MFFIQGLESVSFSRGRRELSKPRFGALRTFRTKRSDDCQKSVYFAEILKQQQQKVALHQEREVELRVEKEIRIQKVVDKDTAVVRSSANNYDDHVNKKQQQEIEQDNNNNNETWNNIYDRHLWLITPLY